MARDSCARGARYLNKYLCTRARWHCARWLPVAAAAPVVCFTFLYFFATFSVVLVWILELLSQLQNGNGYFLFHKLLLVTESHARN